jgi:hypothetical protein
MSVHIPIQTRLRHALLAVLRDGMLPKLAAMGHTFLEAPAFEPLPPGALTGHHIAITGLGALRANDNKAGLRLTKYSRDNLFGYVVEIWCFGNSDDEAQTRAEACEDAINQLLDDPENQYLGELLDNPILIGNTEPLSAEDEKRLSLVWHLAIPLACRVRTTRPEQHHG